MNIKNVYKERLEHLITVLENVPEEKLDMSDWTCGTSTCTIN